MNKHIALWAMLGCCVSSHAQEMLNVTLIGHVDHATVYATNGSSSGEPYLVSTDQDSYGDFASGDRVTLRATIDPLAWTVKSGEFVKEGADGFTWRFTNAPVAMGPFTNFGEPGYSGMSSATLSFDQAPPLGVGQLGLSVALTTPTSLGWTMQNWGGLVPTTAGEIFQGIQQHGLASAWSKLTYSFTDTCRNLLSNECAAVNMQFDTASFQYAGQSVTVPVPEPSSWALLMLGLGGMAYVTTRRRPRN